MIKIKNCSLCPRACGANRTKETGYCGGGNQVRVARAALHNWEEPCISGKSGSGTVFFSGCSLGCCFCQNYQISAENFGVEITVQRLSKIFLELCRKGAHNINLVNPTHYVPWICESIAQVREQLPIPIVYNSSGYESVETLRQLDGLVDIYLPDLKYMDSGLSEKYAKAPDYFNVACKALVEMHRQTGPPVYDNHGLLKKGLLIRHMVLPCARKDSIRILDWIVKTFSCDSVLVSVMSQYTPFYRSCEHPEINRRLTTFEYRSVLEHAESLGLNGYMQERSSATEEFTPAFDLTGVLTDSESISEKYE